MPELPEVETVTNAVRSVAINKEIKKVEFFRANLREKMPQSTIKKVLEGQNLESVRRRGKYIILSTKKGYALIHLGMTGQLIFHTTKTPQRKHTHFIWHLQDHLGSTFYLHYVDPRRFGRFTAELSQKPEQNPWLSELGLEPLSTPKLSQKLFESMHPKKAPIKSLLMNSKLLVGVGNIYACEALFLSGIAPTRRGNQLNKNDFSTLCKNVKKVLRKAIKQGGTTIKDFKHIDGSKGYFKVSLSVYGRTDEACNICNSKIKTIKIAGRSSWFCPSCQR